MKNYIEFLNESTGTYKSVATPSKSAMHKQLTDILTQVQSQVKWIDAYSKDLAKYEKSLEAPEDKKSAASLAKMAKELSTKINLEAHQRIASMFEVFESLK